MAPKTDETSEVLAIDTTVIDALLQRVVTESTIDNVKLEDILQFGLLLMARLRVAPLPPLLTASVMDALSASEPPEPSEPSEPSE